MLDVYMLFKVTSPCDTGRLSQCWVTDLNRLDQIRLIFSYETHKVANIRQAYD